MDVAWIVIGCLILLATFLDTFLAVLNYDEAGFIVNRVMRLQWVVLRSITRRVSRRWRPIVLRQVTGILMITTILIWIGGMVLGFTFIYLGLIGFGRFQLSPGVSPDFVGALYLSVGMFSTASADNIAPGGGWVNLVPVLEALSSIMLLSFIIAFLSNVYGVIQCLRSLCADFFSLGPGVGDPVEGLQPMFPDGAPRDLDRHLDELIDDFNLYCDGLRQDHSAYHFQSGDDQFALPFALYQTSGVVSALRWGLPSGHPASKAPAIERLIEAFDEFRERRYRMMKWDSPVSPEPLTRERFGEEFAAFRDSGERRLLDPWVLRFLVLNDAMAKTIRAEAPTDVDDAYARYLGWLPFAHHAQHFTADVARDLDYQPIYRGVSVTQEPVPIASAPADAAVSRPKRRAKGFAAWLGRRHLLLDPGGVRLHTALRTLGAVVAAVAIAVPLSAAIGLRTDTAGVFAGLIALLAAPSSSGWGPGLMRAAGVLAVVPVVVGIALGAYIPRGPVLSIVVVAVAAAVAMWIGRFGPRFASFGQIAFVTYYFTLLLAVEPGQFVGALIAAVIGVLCSWAANLLPMPSLGRQVRGGIAAVTERSAVLLDSVIDVVSAVGGRAMPRVVRSEAKALRQSVAGLAGLLDPDAPPSGLSAARVKRLRLQAFDVELAAQNLVSALPKHSDYAVAVDQRAVLAGELVAVQAHIRARSASAGEAGVEPGDRVRALELPIEAPDAWPAAARRVHAAIRELSSAIDALHSAEAADEHAVDDAPKADRAAEASPGEVGVARSAHASGHRRAVDRRAVQAGISTGLALFLGRFVSTSEQYWAAMPAYQSLSGTDGETFAKSVQRVVGTVAGAAGAFGLALWTGHSLVVALVVVVVSVFFMSFLRPIASAWTSFWQTVLFASMYDVLGRLDAEAIDIRVIETVIGALVAVLVSAVVLPTRTRTRMLSAMSGVVASATTVAHDAFARLERPGGPRAAETAADARAAMNRGLEELQERAEPLRHNAGALQQGGIETQLTSLSALVHYTRHLVADADAVSKDVAAGSSATVDAGKWQRLDRATGDNFASALAVFADRLPTHAHDVKEVAATAAKGATRAERLALIDIERINQSLHACMISVRPGSVVETDRIE
ncbi:FUSC family protein [Agromyces soli]